MKNDGNEKPFTKPTIQSNSIRGLYLKNVMDRTIREIYNDLVPMFGPGATDAIISKNDQAYYTRDGMEVMQSLIFDSELANYIHHFMYQAADRQGKKVGDGTTTLTVMYSHLYDIARYHDGDQPPEEPITYVYRPALGATKYQSTSHDDPISSLISLDVNSIRKYWQRAVDDITTVLRKFVTPLNDDLLLSMLYTCTQSESISAKIYSNLRDALMAGAYIVPRKSNIDTDFRVTTYTHPLLHVTRLYSLRPVGNEVKNAVIYYCKGMMDITHIQTLWGIATRIQYTGDPKCGGSPINTTVILLCQGITEKTRNTIREFNAAAHQDGFDPESLNNIAIYTLDDFRAMSREELEDVATIITEEPGVGGMCTSITFEALLYRTFCDGSGLPQLVVDKDDILNTVDMELHLIEKAKEMFTSSYPVMFDESGEGMRIERELGPAARERYNELLYAIENEKSSVKKVELNKRLRRTFGMFIDLEVGSALLKDSQRKFELIVDATLSASEAARDGVLIGNSLLYLVHACDIVIAEYSCGMDITDVDRCRIGVCDAIKHAAIACILDQLYNMQVINGIRLINGSGAVSCYNPAAIEIINNRANDTDAYRIEDFNMLAVRENADNDMLCGCWPDKTVNDDILTRHITPIPYTLKNSDGTITPMAINPTVVEPINTITAILSSSVLPVELAKTNVVHISARRGFMQNYID